MVEEGMEENVWLPKQSIVKKKKKKLNFEFNSCPLGAISVNWPFLYERNSQMRTKGRRDVLFQMDWVEDNNLILVIYTEIFQNPADSRSGVSIRQSTPREKIWIASAEE